MGVGDREATTNLPDIHIPKGGLPEGHYREEDLATGREDLLPNLFEGFMQVSEDEKG